jgi:hypothetical protein
VGSRRDGIAIHHLSIRRRGTRCSRSGLSRWGDLFDGRVESFGERFLDRWESILLLGRKRGTVVVEPSVETRVLGAIKMVGKLGLEAKLEGFLLMGTVKKT